MNPQSPWFDEVSAGMVVCDEKGIILSMNDRAALIFKRNGGKALIGQSLMGCHPPDAQQKILHLLETKTPHAYAVEQNGRKTLLYQVPWFEEGKFKGYVEFILPLPEPMETLSEIRWVK